MKLILYLMVTTGFVYRDPIPFTSTVSTSNKSAACSWWKTSYTFVDYAIIERIDWYTITYDTSDHIHRIIPLDPRELCKGE